MPISSGTICHCRAAGTSDWVYAIATAFRLNVNASRMAEEEAGGSRSY